jgi:hypothetical protein
MELSQVNKQYVKPVMMVFNCRPHTTLLQTSGKFGGNPATKPASAPEFDDWDEF